MGGETYRVVGFTGTRRGMTEAQKKTLAAIVESSDCSEVHHGDCIGADEDFHDIVERLALGMTIVIHPSNCDAMRAYKGEGEFDTLVLPPKPPLDRNRDIVACSEVLFAATHGYEEESRSGTWATIRYAREKGIPVAIVRPDGGVVWEQNRMKAA